MPIIASQSSYIQIVTARNSNVSRRLTKSSAIPSRDANTTLIFDQMWAWEEERLRRASTIPEADLDSVLSRENNGGGSTIGRQVGALVRWFKILAWIIVLFGKLIALPIVLLSFSDFRSLYNERKSYVFLNVDIHISLVAKFWKRQALMPLPGFRFRLSLYIKKFF